MTIVGMGTDLIEIDRMRQALARRGERLRQRLFTDREIAYCQAKRDPYPHYAARFAAKEAFFKALGSGWRGGLRWNEVEVVRTEMGKPTLALAGRVHQWAEARGIQEGNVQLSLTHSRDYALSTVIIHG
ncbi:MAG: holo-ACP synthase [Candidatus Tectomicrobia bacterium]|uniref:Holo-[acyl-carrier-protein] synthase n=1 Tax=Tectimicrobiota bacterium TaxID=2528274 RepID=A0A932CR44_UNCTE|nr:holo-ACP synthase [Candidatus Tectomicrobia bacterium]